MELMSGQTLKDLVLRRGPLPYEEAIQLILQCIDGLIETHSKGMIHRDIKPANCYLDDQGNVKIGDFGLARSLVDDSELTRTGAFLGTPLFASPEQVLGQSIDTQRFQWHLKDWQHWNNNIHPTRKRINYCFKIT